MDTIGKVVNNCILSMKMTASQFKALNSSFVRLIFFRNRTINGKESAVQEPSQTWTDLNEMAK
jgi:hypothetical protein